MGRPRGLTRLNPKRREMINMFGVSGRVIDKVGLARLEACKDDEARAVLLHRGLPFRGYRKSDKVKEKANA